MNMLKNIKFKFKINAWLKWILICALVILSIGLTSQSSYAGTWTSAPSVPVDNSYMGSDFYVGSDNKLYFFGGYLYRLDGTSWTYLGSPFGGGYHTQGFDKYFYQSYNGKVKQWNGSSWVDKCTTSAPVKSIGPIPPSSGYVLIGGASSSSYRNFVFNGSFWTQMSSSMLFYISNYANSSDVNLIAKMGLDGYYYVCFLDKYAGIYLYKFTTAGTLVSSSCVAYDTGVVAYIPIDFAIDASGNGFVIVHEEENYGEGCTYRLKAVRIPDRTIFSIPELGESWVGYLEPIKLTIAPDGSFWLGSLKWNGSTFASVGAPVLSRYSSIGPDGCLWTANGYKYNALSWSVSPGYQSATITATFDGNPLKSVILQRSTDGVNYTDIYTFTGSSTSFTDTGLGDNTTYYYRLKFYANNGFAFPATEVVRSVITAPAKPNTPTIFQSGGLSWSNSAGRGYVVLNWPAVAGATGYKVYVFAGNDYYAFDVGNTTSWDSRVAKIYPAESWLDSQGNNTVSSDPFNHVQGGLDLRDTPNKLYLKTVGTTYDSANNYWFGVSAYNASGESPMSNPATPTLPNRTDTTAPTISSITINNGDTKTSSNQVTVQVTASDPLVANYTSDTSDDASGLSQIGLSNDNTAWTWMSFSSNVNWTVTAGPGQKTVYVKVRDNAGNESSMQAATIYLVDDTEGPKGTLLINNGASTTDTTNVTLMLSVSDNFAQPTQIQMRFSNDGSNWSSWEIYNGVKNWTLTSGDGWKTVYCQLKDAQSNYTTISAQIALVTSASAPSGSAAPSNPPPTVTFNGLSNVYSTKLQQVTISSTGLSNVRKASFSFDGINWSPPEDVSGGTYNKDVTLPSGDGLKGVYIKFQNAYGVWSQPIVKTFLVDTTPPEIKVSTRNRATATTTSSITLNILVKDNFSQVTTDTTAPRIYYRYSINGGSWSSYAPLTSPSITVSGLDFGPNDIGIQVKDAAGNESEVQYVQVFKVA
ncbi:MAG: hypothetical protein HPY90_10175 [Syntrophothermus sp.]|nr:hypothetical protein [Syntrophothermus sp.]